MSNCVVCCAKAIPSENALNQDHTVHKCCLQSCYSNYLYLKFGIYSYTLILSTVKDALYCNWCTKAITSDDETKIACLATGDIVLYHRNCTIHDNKIS